MKDIVFVTGNKNKAKHLSDLLGIEIDYHDIELQEIQSMDVVEVAREKAIRAYDIIQRPVLVEDQAVYLEALGGFPGPFIKYMVESSGGIESIARIINDYDNRRCIAKDVFVYYDGEHTEIFVGEHGGTIANSPRGTGGWGWDPVYCPDGFGGKTSAELSEKDYEDVYLKVKPIELVRTFLNDQ